VIILGGLMTLYTVVGGMVGATYIQIFKTSLLLVMVLTLFVVVISRTGWNPLGPMKEAAAQMGDDVMRVDRSDSTVSWNFISLNMGLVLGMMAMPHIMVRFLTVRDGRAARSSAQGAMWIFAPLSQQFSKAGKLLRRRFSDLGCGLWCPERLRVIEDIP